MIGIFFAVAYWGAVMLVVFGAVCLLVFIALTVDDYLDRFRDVPHVPQAQRVPPRPVVPGVRPFDQNDPLEQLFLLPDAPNPRRLAS